MAEVKVPTTPEDAFLGRLKSARTTSAVLKARLITLKANFPDALVFAFEGDDDKIVYGQWIRGVFARSFYMSPFRVAARKA
jgi:hypothetical protein